MNEHTQRSTTTSVVVVCALRAPFYHRTPPSGKKRGHRCHCLFRSLRVARRRQNRKEHAHCSMDTVQMSTKHTPECEWHLGRHLQKAPLLLLGRPSASSVPFGLNEQKCLPLFSPRRSTRYDRRGAPTPILPSSVRAMCTRDRACLVGGRHAGAADTE